MADIKLSDILYINTNEISGVPITAAEAGYLGGAVAGTASASHCVVLNSSRNITNINDITITGNINSAGAVSGNTVTDGTASLTSGTGTNFKLYSSVINTQITGTAIETGTTLTTQNNRIPSNYTVKSYIDSEISSLSVPPQWNFITDFTNTGSTTLGQYTTIPSGTTGFRFLFHDVNLSNQTGFSDIKIQFSVAGNYTSTNYIGCIAEIAGSPNLEQFSGNAGFSIIYDISASNNEVLNGIAEFFKRSGNNLQGTAHTNNYKNASYIAAGVVYPTNMVTHTKVISDFENFSSGSSCKLWLYY